MSAEAERRALYAGAVELLPAGAASRRLVAHVWALLEEALGPEPRRVHERLQGEALLQRVAPVRQALKEKETVARVQEVLREAGWDPAEYALDWPRLRVVAHQGHLLRAAAPAYAIHRDTWYGNPQAQINHWIPLHPVTAEDSLFFFPERFDQPVRNDSSGFDYERFVREVGWQRTQAGGDAVYPAAQEDLRAEPRRSVVADAAQVLRFAAAHCHGTAENQSGRTRFSVDFRVVHRGDHDRGLGAPNVDSRCQGSSLRDYVAAGS